MNRLRLQGKQLCIQTQDGEKMVPDAPLKCQLKNQEPEAIAPTVMDAPFVDTETQRIESPNIAAMTAIAKEPSYKPPTPSPLGISNYDALDLEDEFPEVEEFDDDGADGGRRRDSIYSDFSSFEAFEGTCDGEEESFGGLKMWS